MRIVGKKLVATAILGASLLLSPTLSQAESKVLYQKFVANTEKLLTDKQGVPQPPLSDEELMELIGQMKEKYAAAGHKYSDIQIASILGIIGGAEAFQKSLRKAFSK